MPGLTCSISVVGDHSDTPAFHLLEKSARFNRAHKKDDLKRFYVRAGGDHIDSYGDPWKVAIAKGLKNLVRREIGYLLPDGFICLSTVRADFLLHIAHKAGAVRDLLAEIVALIENFAADAHNVIGVCVVLGEDQSFWHVFSAWKDFRKELVSKSLQHRADLVVGNHVAVELIGRVLKVVIELLPAPPAGQAISLVDVKAGVDLAPWEVISVCIR
jgi:hypothetical protein